MSEVNGAESTLEREVRDWLQSFKDRDPDDVISVEEMGPLMAAMGAQQDQIAALRGRLDRMEAEKGGARKHAFTQKQWIIAAGAGAVLLVLLWFIMSEEPYRYYMDNPPMYRINERTGEVEALVDYGARWEPMGE